VKHFRSITEAGPEALRRLLDLADHMAAVNRRPNPKVPALRGKTVCNIFFEDSTRTRLSFETAAKRLAPAWRVTVDAGAHMFPATMLWPVADPSGMLISNGLSTMGWAVPAAIGAALADRERPVVALTGDGGLLMSASELLTAVRERLKIMVIVFNDASLSLIEIKQRQRRQPAAGVALGAVDWVGLAASFGIPGWRATDEAGLAGAVDSAMGADGPSLVEACIDRSNYGAILKAIRG